MTKERKQFLSHTVIWFYVVQQNQNFHLTMHIPSESQLKIKESKCGGILWLMVKQKVGSNIPVDLRLRIYFKRIKLISRVFNSFIWIWFVSIFIDLLILITIALFENRLSEIITYQLASHFKCIFILNLENIIHGQLLINH